MFAALEAVDISDLFRDMHVWVSRVNDTSGDVSFADLSDGERQLLMVLGLIRISRGKRTMIATMTGRGRSRCRRRMSRWGGRGSRRSH
jgi:S-adenosylmethionine synthetase